jgi:hypothetical protein
VPGRPEIVRLLALAAFISVVAVATWLAELSRTLVIVVMAAALAVAWAIEWLAWRETRLRLAHEFVEEQEEEEAPFEQPVEAAGPVETAEPAEPAAVAEPARSERSWFLLKRAAARHEEAADNPPLVPIAPVVEGRARVMEADATRDHVVGEEEEAEPAAPELHEPVLAKEAPSAEVRPPLRPVPPSPSFASEPAPREDDAVVHLAARARGPRTWNLWELERLAREEFKGETLEQSQYLFIHLRQFARADGQLPLEFDELVRDSFGGLLERLQHV